MNKSGCISYPTPDERQAAKDRALKLQLLGLEALGWAYYSCEDDVGIGKFIDEFCMIDALVREGTTKLFVPFAIKTTTSPKRVADLRFKRSSNTPTDVDKLIVLEGSIYVRPTYFLFLYFNGETPVEAAWITTADLLNAVNTVPDSYKEIKPYTDNDGSWAEILKIDLKYLERYESFKRRLL